MSYSLFPGEPDNSRPHHRHHPTSARSWWPGAGESGGKSEEKKSNKGKDEFLEKFQTAFDPPPPSFMENYIAIFL